MSAEIQEGLEGTDSEVSGSSTEDFTPNYDELSSTLNEDNSGEDTSQDTNTDATGKNPAWDPILSLIPEQLHSQVIPHLSKTDKHVQQLQQSIAPYKSIIDRGISPDVINQSLTLGQAIAENPQAVYDQMRSQFNLTHEQAIEAINDAGNEDDEDSQGYEGYGDPEDGEEDVVSNHPLVLQLQQQLADVQQQREEQQREVMMNNIREEVNREWSDIEKMAGGRLSESVRNDIQMRALNIAGENGMPKLMDGFREHIQFASQIRNSSANNTAPPVADGTGLLPSSRTYDKSTPEGMQAFIADFVIGMNGGK